MSLPHTHTHTHTHTLIFCLIKKADSRSFSSPVTSGIHMTLPRIPWDTQSTSLRTGLNWSVGERSSGRFLTPGETVLAANVCVHTHTLTSCVRAHTHTQVYVLLGRWDISIPKQKSAWRGWCRPLITNNRKYSWTEAAAVPTHTHTRLC